MKAGKHEKTWKSMKAGKHEKTWKSMKAGKHENPHYAGLLVVGY